MTESKNSEQEKKFFTAVKDGHLVTVKELAGRSPELLRAYDHDEFGGPCLNLVSGHRSNLEMVGQLLELGADVNQKSDWWAGPWSPALLSVDGGDDTIARLLISKGAEIDVHLAAGISDLNRLSELLKEDPELISARGGDGGLPLHFAGSVEIVDALLERGADIEARDVDHYSTPVQWIAARSPAVARHLFTRGAKPDIFSATLSGAGEVVTRLIEDEPEVLYWRMNQEYFPPGSEHDVHNIMTFKVGAEATPLHAAAVGNQARIIKLLVSRGLDVNVKGAYDACSALHLAAWNNRLEAAIALIDAGAAIEQESGEIHKNTPMGWAIVAGSVDVAELLLKRGCVVRDNYTEAVKQGIAGDFRQYRSVNKENYEKIRELLNKA